jgi:hypothetical protein
MNYTVDRLLHRQQLSVQLNCYVVLGGTADNQPTVTSGPSLAPGLFDFLLGLPARERIQSIGNGPLRRFTGM